VLRAARPVGKTPHQAGWIALLVFARFDPPRRMQAGPPSCSARQLGSIRWAAFIDDADHAPPPPQAHAHRCRTTRWGAASRRSLPDRIGEAARGLTSRLRSLRSARIELQTIEHRRRKPAGLAARIIARIGVNIRCSASRPPARRRSAPPPQPLSAPVRNRGGSAGCGRPMSASSPRQREALSRNVYHGQVGSMDRRFAKMPAAHPPISLKCPYVHGVTHAGQGRLSRVRPTPCVLYIGRYSPDGGRTHGRDHLISDAPNSQSSSPAACSDG